MGPFFLSAQWEEPITFISWGMLRDQKNSVDQTPRSLPRQHCLLWPVTHTCGEGKVRWPCRMNMAHSEPNKSSCWPTWAYRTLYKSQQWKQGLSSDGDVTTNPPPVISSMASSICGVRALMEMWMVQWRCGWSNRNVMWIVQQKYEASLHLIKECLNAK